MRYLRIFLLYFQDVFEQRGQSFIWFLIATIVPLILILFWRGAKSLGNWTFQDILSYYLLFIAFATLLMSHCEDHIARKDIQEGELSSYLIKPFSYFWIAFFRQLPWRLLQGTVGVFILSLIAFMFPNLFVITTSPLLLSLSVVIIVLAYFVSFLFKAIVGIIAFWMTETKGLFETVDVTVLIFAGYLMPLVFFPSWLYQFAQYMPFPYMLYFPVVALQGKLTLPELYTVLGIQCIWILILSLGFRYLWRAGVRQYTAVGQ